MRLLNNIIGKEILDEKAKIIGKVKDIEIDTSSNKIESIIIMKDNSFNKKLTRNKTEEKIPFETVNKIGDKIILKQSLNDIDIIIEKIEKEI